MQNKDKLTLLIAALGVGFGAWQYSKSSRADFLQPIRESQLKLYEEASSAAATLATTERNSEDWKKAYGDFYRLYYGPLAMLENYRHEATGKDQKAVTVERAMIVFGQQLEARANATTLRNLSLALAHTCRTSLATSWGFSADQLRGDYQEMIIRLDSGERPVPATSRSGS